MRAAEAGAITTTPLNVASRLRTRSVTTSASASLVSPGVDARKGSTAIVRLSSGTGPDAAAGTCVAGTDSRRSPTNVSPASTSTATPAATYVLSLIHISEPTRLL